MLSTDYIRDGCEGIIKILKSFVTEAVMHHRHECVLHSLRHVMPMEVDMQKLRQTTKCPKGQIRTCLLETCWYNTFSSRP